MLEDTLKLKLKDIGLSDGIYCSVRSRLLHRGCKEPTVQNLVDAGILELTRCYNFGAKSMETVLAKMQELGVPFTISSTDFERWSKLTKKEYEAVLRKFNAIVDPSAQLEMVSLDSLHQTLPQGLDIEDFNITTLTKYGMVALKALPAKYFAEDSKTMQKIESLKLAYIQILAQGMTEVTPEKFPEFGPAMLGRELERRCDKMFDEQCAFKSIVSEKRGELAKTAAVETKPVSPVPPTKNNNGKKF